MFIYDATVVNAHPCFWGVSGLAIIGAVLLAAIFDERKLKK